MFFLQGVAVKRVSTELISELVILLCFAGDGQQQFHCELESTKSFQE